MKQISIDGKLARLKSKKNWIVSVHSYQKIELINLSHVLLN